jgi:hypothetical protein
MLPGEGALTHADNTRPPTCRDKLVGMSLASGLGCIALGLFIRFVFFRFVRVPLLEVC